MVKVGKVEKDIPMPKSRVSRKDIKIDGLEVGESVLIECDADEIAPVRSAAYRKAKDLGWSITTSAKDDAKGLRLWRTK